MYVHITEQFLQSGDPGCKSYATTRASLLQSYPTYLWADPIYNSAGKRVIGPGSLGWSLYVSTISGSYVDVNHIIMSFVTSADLELYMQHDAGFRSSDAHAHAFNHSHLHTAALKIKVDKFQRLLHLPLTD